MPARLAAPARGGLLRRRVSSGTAEKITFPANDSEFPWLGIWTAFLSVEIWHNCTNQFIVQRCLGVRSEWEPRMGGVFAGDMKIVLPLLVVIPGIVACRLYPNLPDKDLAFPTLVRELLPVHVDSKRRRVGGRADRDRVSRGRVLASRHRGGGDLRAVVWFPVYLVRRDTVVQFNFSVPPRGASFIRHNPLHSTPLHSTPPHP